MTNSITYQLLDDVAVRAITSSTNAAPIVVTTPAHGYSTGDRITINGHLINTAANGTWTVTVLSATTFSLDGSTGNGVGGATGVFATAARVIFARDFDKAILSFSTDGGGDADMTVQVASSDSDVSPDFAAPATLANEYDFSDVIDLQDGTPIDGDTGFTTTGDKSVRYQLNNDGQEWFTVLPTAGTKGEISVSAKLFNHN